MEIIRHISIPQESPLNTKEVNWRFIDILKLVGLHLLIVILLPVPNKLNPLRLRLTDWTALLAVLWWYRHYSFWPTPSYFGLLWGDFKEHWKTGVLWGLGLKALPTLLTVLAMVVVAMFTPIGEVPGNNPLPSVGMVNLEWGILAFAIGIVAPIVEEIIYRGLIYPLLRQRYGVKVGIVFSSLLFGLMHGFSFVGLFAMLAGVGFAVLYERTGSLAPCIIAHSVGNLASILLSLINFI